MLKILGSRETDVLSFRAFYAELLLHSVINPCRSLEPKQILYDDLAKAFGEKYGAFRYLLCGNLKRRVENSSGLMVQGEVVLQNKQGAVLGNNWHLQLSITSKSVCFPEKNSKAVCNTVPIPKVNEQKQRTSQWVFRQSEELINISKFPKMNWDETEPLQRLLPDFGLQYSFFLISGKNTPPDRFNGISNIPWLKVFDFNVESKNNGLLSSVENIWKRKWYSTLSTCSTGPKPLSNDSTDWFFPLGYSDMGDTLFDGSPLAWFNSNKALLDKQFSSIANFCALQTVPVFLILWYDPEKNNVRYLNCILSVLSPAFKSDKLPKQIILCYDKKSCNNSSFQDVVEFYELKDTTIDISAETVYKWLARQSVPIQPEQDVMRLPANKTIADNEIVEVTDKVLLLWIQQFVEILPLESQSTIDSRKSVDFGKDFVKGGIISWDELASGSKLAVRRDGKENVWKCLKTEVLEKKKSVVLRIQHAPGGGGTTFARQLLWDFHFKLPCGVVKANLTLSIAQISEAVRHLYDQANLPVVLLIDGHSEFEINQIFENCKYAVVILHVQRYSKEISHTDFSASSTTCRLTGRVTFKEAVNLTKVYSSFSPSSAKTLERFTNDVKNEKKKRFVFEYGLAAFNHEFKGVRKYVQGYLERQKQKDGVKNLHDWQRVIGYLSLALYYGQSGVHRETFRSLVDVKEDKFVSLKHLHYSGSQFIIETKGEWKISHNIVAKEILEQILCSCASTPTDSTEPELSVEARKNLHELVIDFILMIQAASEGYAPEKLIHLLTNMIIRRDYSEVDKSDGITSSKASRHSKLLEDIPEPNRVSILEHLTAAFPQNAEFHAHLGRLLNIIKEFERGESSLQTALRIRNEECQNLEPDFTDDRLSRIHHMIGVGYSRRAEHEHKRVSTGNYQSMLEYVKKAVDHFGEARRHTTYSLSYGCLGEINVRLLLVEFVHQKFSEGCTRAINFKLGRKHVELSEFVLQSHAVCDRLLALSLQYSTEQELKRIRTYTNCIEKFNYLYGNIRSEMSMQFKRETNPNISMQRSQITCLKMENRPNSNGSKRPSRPCIENVRNSKDLQKIIRLYESIFRQVFREGHKHESISVDVLEWLEAIRHRYAPDEYTLEQVLQIVKNWEKKNEPGYATFYLYVINFMLAVFSAGANLNMQYYNTAMQLKEKLLMQRYKCDVTKMQVWRLEWIAHHINATSVRKLINREKLGSWDKEKRFWKNKEDMQKLQVFTGTVIQSNHPLKGNINLDTIQSLCKFRVEVYFVPKLYNLDQSRYAEQKQRVEFCIGFSCKHGAEAFEVKKLEKGFCLSCSLEAEIITHNQPHGGRCRNCAII